MSRVLITGATSGLGYQLALDYAAKGVEVIACGRNEVALQSLRAKSERIGTLCFDVTDREATRQALQGLTPLPSVIILNAGVCEYIEQGNIDSALFKRVFEANFFGVLHCIEALQSQFSRDTHLVLVGSSAAYVPLPRAEAYGASKAAIAYLAHTLSVDLNARGVTVSLVSPGFIKTPLTDKNDFPMPMLISGEQASLAVIAGIEKKKRDIHFPQRFTLLLKAIALLPLAWRLPLITKMIRRAE
uniref:SDR family NAD(P)-dependent oxidoreductase n=1 Tax=Thaumasiovibrio occultus TaxID=1891184 RepID=UPI000B34AC10|nr:SDR family NAD(P)-dependent oxidoreductase [Thaumasiovibrio occultus]